MTGIHAGEGQQPPPPKSVNIPRQQQAGTPQAKSFLAAVTCCNIPSQQIEHGRPCVSFTKEEVEILAERFNRALVGSFFHGRPSLPFIRSHLEKIGFTDFSVTLLDETHVLLHFTKDEDFLRCFKRYEWKLGCFEMKVSKWTPNFDPRVRSHKNQLKDAETSFDTLPTPENRETMNAVRANLTLAAHDEYLYWKQKANLKWAKEGDLNTAFFHSKVKEKRHHQTIRKIKNQSGNWSSNQVEIQDIFHKHFNALFQHEQTPLNNSFTINIPSLITPEDNLLLTQLPLEDEVKTAVWALKADSAAGPDGYNGNFFKKHWNWIKEDVTKATQEFFLGIKMPKQMALSTIILIPKKENPSYSEDYRPICLSNFAAKIIPKIFATRLGNLLPKVISQEQGGFVKGRSINEQVLLAHEMLHAAAIIRQRNGNFIGAWTKISQGETDPEEGMADQRKRKKVRGAGKCEKLYKRRREGHPPIELEWERGEPIRGPYVSEFSGLVGFEDIYVIPPVGARHVMTVAAERLCAFRTYLRKAYLKEGGDHYGKYPPNDYTFVELLARRIGIYRRRIPIRTIWAEVDMPCSSVSLPLLLRPPLLLISLVRLSRRVLSSDRRTLSCEVQLKKEVAAGTFVPHGHNDVLTRALGTAKHPGRTRGVGSYSGLRKVFKGNMKPRNYMTEEDLLQPLPSLLQQYGLSVSGSAPEGASMLQHTPSVPPHYEQRSSKASTNYVDVAGVTEVAPCYLRISDLADYIVAHGSIFPRAPGDMVHGVPLLPHQVKVSVTLVLPGMGEYTNPCPTEHMETVADCEGSFVAWPKSLVGVGDPLVQTARHGDFSSSKSRPILGIRPTAPSSPVQDVVD
ncbi:unnamed protein product [Cuscuta campestris]|uniref:Reverse transcriptase domain-containing protein n=1 Tax=Cuscuta campestris TaxID=132261 RepID=A0A484MAC7_9ASTE|nr:unnamed protein product [Cuscuta campestris]